MIIRADAKKYDPKPSTFVCRFPSALRLAPVSHGCYPESALPGLLSRVCFPGSAFPGLLSRGPRADKPTALR